MSRPETEAVIKQLQELALDTEPLNEKRATQTLAIGILHVLFAVRDIEAKLERKG